MYLQERINDAKELYGENSECIDDYYFLIFKKEKYLENDIFQIYVNSKGNNENRIGWLLPIEAIFSQEHDFFGNPHFAIYAQLCIEFLEINCIETEYKPFDNFHLLVLNKTRASANGYHNINNIICSLVKYSYNDSTLCNDDVYYVNSESEKLISEFRKDNIMLVSLTNLQSFSYLENLLKERLKKENHYYLRFILIYQVYEYLMEKIFYKTVKEYETLNLNIGTVREKIGEMSSERKLINKLFTDKQLKVRPDSDFELQSTSFLKNFKDDQYFSNGLDIPMIIYDIRNILVHNFYKYNGDDVSVQEIVDKVEIITLESIEQIFDITKI